MPKRPPLIVANWKMNGSWARLEALTHALRKGIGTSNAVQTALCPPFVYLAGLAEALAGSNIALGAQNLSQHADGAYTGEVSAHMLQDYNCRFVIVGHSERRELYGENDQVVAEKFVAALEADLTPILCVGERLEERDAGVTETVIDRQLQTAIGRYGKELPEQTVIAYEPIWAIGTGRSAAPGQAQEVHAFIRCRLAQWNAARAEQVRILYGGSVREQNAGALLAMEDIDGGLIGGASLHADSFLAICKAAA